MIAINQALSNKCYSKITISNNNVTVTGNNMFKQLVNVSFNSRVIKPLPMI